MTDLAPVDDDDLFTPADGRLATRYGLNDGGPRYIFSPPPGQPFRKSGYRRMTKVVSAFSDQERLQLWLEWKAFMGLRNGDGLLFDEWMAEPLEGMTPEAQKALANRYAEVAREAAGADAAARRGTARHKMMDTYLTTGQRTGTRPMRAQLDSALEALDRCGFEVVQSEFRVWHPVAGGTIVSSGCGSSCACAPLCRHPRTKTPT